MSFKFVFKSATTRSLPDGHPLTFQLLNWGPYFLYARIRQPNATTVWALFSQQPMYGGLFDNVSDQGGQWRNLCDLFMWTASLITYSWDILFLAHGKKPGDHVELMNGLQFTRTTLENMLTCVHEPILNCWKPLIGGSWRSIILLTSCGKDQISKLLLWGHLS